MYILYKFFSFAPFCRLVPKKSFQKNIYLLVKTILAVFSWQALTFLFLCIKL